MKLHAKIAAAEKKAKRATAAAAATAAGGSAAKQGKAKKARKVTPTKQGADRTVTPSPKPRQAGNSVSPPAEMLLTGDDGSDWRRSGHAALGRTVLRTVGGLPELGTLIGWIPESGAQPAQWRVRAEGGDEADLDGAAMQAGVEAFKRSFAQPAAEEWHTAGHVFIGCAVRRALVEAGGHADAVVVGWLPPEVADFVCEKTGKPAALWRIRYTSEPLAGDCEDLEEHEVRGACELWNKTGRGKEKTGKGKGAAAEQGAGASAAKAPKQRSAPKKGSAAVQAR